MKQENSKTCMAWSINKVHSVAERTFRQSTKYGDAATLIDLSNCHEAMETIKTISIGDWAVFFELEKYNREKYLCWTESINILIIITQ